MKEQAPAEARTRRTFDVKFAQLVIVSHLNSDGFLGD